MTDRLLRFGIVGAAVAGVCCFTPVLVIALGALGAAWLTGYLDFVLLPVLCVFMGIIAYALWRRSRRQ